MAAPPPPEVLFEQPSSRERRFLGDILRQETVGGAIMLAAAALGLVLANTAAVDWYQSVQNYVIGPEALNLDLPLKKWAADGLLAIFFFIAGLELKREVVLGSLRRPAAAAVPIAAAIGGMVAPALIYSAWTRLDGIAAEGWAIPTATDIAFALAILAIAGTHLPSAMRAFLLTLAIVDDVLAIIIIAVFFTDALILWPLAVAAVLCLVYWLLQQRHVRAWYVYVPIALTVWALFHESGVHATVAGVVLGLLTKVRPGPGETVSPAERLEHDLRPVSAGFAVPVFAFLSAGVVLTGGKIGNVLADPISQGVILGLVVGKLIGVFSGAFLVAKLTRAQLSKNLVWGDVAGLAMVSGIGFTVSLLIAELAFESDLTELDNSKVGVLIGSVISAVIALVILRLRNRVYRQLAAEETYSETPDTPSAMLGDNPGKPDDAGPQPGTRDEKGASP